MENDNLLQDLLHQIDEMGDQEVENLEIFIDGFDRLHEVEKEAIRAKLGYLKTLKELLPQKSKPRGRV